MRIIKLALVLVAVLAFNAQAAPEPEPAKGLSIAFPRSRATGVVKGGSRKTESSINDDRASNADVDDDGELDADEDVDMKKIASQSNKNSDPSKGRLFLNKLLLFRNVFGQQQQPVIPIIITGGTGTAPLTYPTTSTFPSTTGTLSPTSTSPGISGSVATSPTSPVAGNGGRRDVLKDQEDQQGINDAAAVVDEKDLQEALAAGAQEYVVTDQEIRGTSDAKANRAPARVNLRRPGGKGGQMITVRIPARYRKYFRNGQRVMLNTRNRNRPVNRRGAQKRRNNRNRRRRGSNKRRRVNN